MDCSLTGSLSMGFPRQEYWSGLLLPPPGDLPDPGIEPRSPAFQADALKEIVNSPYHHPIYLSVQCCHSVVSNSLRPQGLQHCQPSLSITNTWSLLKLMSFESMMPSSHLILYHPLLLLPSIFPSIRVFSNESVLLHSAFFIVQLSYPYMTTGKTIALTRWIFVSK